MSDKPQAEMFTIEIEKDSNAISAIVGPSEPLRKDSQQIAEAMKQLKIVQPRYSFDDLLFFLEVNTWHKRAIGKKAALVAGLGWRLETDDENKQADGKHREISAFLERPNANSRDTFNGIMRRFMIDYFATGNAWLEVSRANSGQAAELYHVPARTVRRNAEFNGYWQVRTFKKVQFDDWGKQEAGRNQLLHHCAYDPICDYYGVPDWLPAIASMALDRNAVEYNTYLFENDLLAKFAVIIEGGQLSASGKAALKKFLQNKYKTIKNAGRAIVIGIDDPNVKIRIEKLDMDGANKEMSFIRSREFNRDEVAAAHAIPPRLLGIMSAGQLGGGGEIEGQLTIFKQTEVNPEQKELEAYLNRTIIASFGEHKWQLKFEEFDITTAKDDANFYDKMLTQQVLDTDEVREEIGYKPRRESASHSRPAADASQELTRAITTFRKALEVADAWD